jgi:hypothetical protein
MNELGLWETFVDAMCNQHFIKRNHVIKTLINRAVDYYSKSINYNLTPVSILTKIPISFEWESDMVRGYYFWEGVSKKIKKKWQAYNNNKNTSIFK